ncbi:MAG: site-specific DNA-methyltransferase [Bacteroidales bacterium]|nr:site-specific DNA-methyltransferase [Bacteroidales bacterium]
MKVNKLYQMDCVEYMKTLPDKCVNMVFCDSPYGQNIRNERGKIKFDTEWKDEDEFLNWCRLWLLESKRILKDDGMLFVWGVAPVINEISHILNKELEMKFYTQIIWHVSDGLRPTNNYFYSNHQVLLGYSKSNKDVFNSFNNHGGIYNHFTEKANSYSGTKNMGTVWKHCKVSKNHKEGTIHPTQKPLELCNRIIKSCSNEGDLIYIPFAGSGSEIEACINNNRNYIATEINHEYIEIINERIKNNIK